MSVKKPNLLLVSGDVEDDTSSFRTTIIKESPKLTIDSLPYETNRILLRHVPYYISKEHLELYIDYLSDGVDIERIDQSKIDPYAMMVTFKDNTDYYSIHQNYTLKPKLNESRIDLQQVEKPKIIFVQFGPHVNKEMLDLYFSNRKKSLGGHVSQIIMDTTQTCALVAFEDHQTARRLMTKQHQINKQNISVKLYYKYFGLNPVDPDEFSQHYQYYNNKTSEKLRQLTLAMNVKSDLNKQSLTHHKSQTNSNSIKLKIEKQQQQNISGNDSIKQKSVEQRHRRTPSKSHVRKVTTTASLPEPPKSVIVNKSPVIEVKRTDEIKTFDEVTPVEAEVKSTTPTPYEYEIIQSLFSYDSQMFLETALGEHMNQKLLDEESVNILDYKQYPLVTSLFDSHLKEPIKTENKSEKASTPVNSITEPLVKVSRCKKVVVRLHDLQKQNKPVAPKLVSKSVGGDSNKTSERNSSDSLQLKAGPMPKASINLVSKSSNDVGIRNEPALIDPKVYLSTAQINNIDGVLNKVSKEQIKPIAVFQPSGKNPYGAYSIAQSIDRLKLEQIHYLKMSKHLKEVQQMYPKLRINLNEKTRHLYLFGSPKQVNDVKTKFKTILDSLNIAEFKLDSYELALFVKKETIQEKLLKFIQLFFDNNDSKDAIYFCIYDVIIDKDANSYKLVIYANSTDICQTLFKYIIENIRVSYKLKLNSLSLIEMIKETKEGDDRWALFYKKYYKNSIDYVLQNVQSETHSPNSAQNHNVDSSLKIQDVDDLTGNYMLSITGFREDVDEFCSEFRNKFLED